jgi:hypothetical protein
MTKHETTICIRKLFSSFGFRHYFVIRHSDFVINSTLVTRHCRPIFWERP